MMVINPHILFAGKHIENVGILDIAFIPRKKKVCTKAVCNAPIQKRVLLTLLLAFQGVRDHSPAYGASEERPIYY